MKGFFLSITVFSLLFSLNVSAQNTPEYKAKVKSAATLFKDKNYEKALEYYLQLDSIVDEDEPEYRFRIAVCYLNTFIDKTKAIPYLLDTRNYFYEKGEEENYYFYLGKAYHLAYRFDEAIMAYDKFIKLVSKRDRRVPKILREIEMCMNGKNLIKNAVEVDIENLGPKVNSKHADYTPVISADESVIIFNSRREGSTGGLMNSYGKPDSVNGSYFDDIFVSIKFNESWLKPVSIGSSLNTPGHDAVIGLSPDGQRLYVYRSDSVLWGNIFECRLRGYNWGRLKKLPAPINSKYLESNASISSEGDKLYFTSNRPKNVGDADKDVYLVRKLPNGEYAKPSNLGSMINTPFDEISPFIHPDGKTLYFSSKGHNSMGGYDIFKSTMGENGNWSVPVNLGHPINTPGDDIDFVLSADGKRGYYASARPGGYGGQDIYVIHFSQEYQDVAPGPVTMVKGSIVNCSNTVPFATINVFDAETDQLKAVYRPNEATGKFMIIVPKGVQYNFIAEAAGYQTFEWSLNTPLNEGYKEEISNILMCPDVADTTCSKCKDGSDIVELEGTEVFVEEVVASSMTAVADIINTIRNRDAVFEVQLNDISLDAAIDLASIRTLKTTNNGTLDYDQDYGEYDYTPDLGFSGIDSFQYKICNKIGDCGTAWVKINVKDPSAKNEEPNVLDDEVTVTFNGDVTIDVLNNDSDKDGLMDKNSLKIQREPYNGGLILNIVEGNFKYTPKENFIGKDSFVYRVCDNVGDCGEAVVYIAVLDAVKEEIKTEVEEVVSTIETEQSESKETPSKASEEPKKFRWEDAARGEKITVYNVYYNYDKWDLRSDSKEPLNDLVKFLDKYKEMKIEVGAHTDSRGSSNYNKSLSLKRAESVKKYLMENNISANRVKPAGYGEEDPIHKCPTDEACTEEQHQLNRRTTFILLGEDNTKIVESIKPDFVEVDPRPGSAYYKQIDESTSSRQDSDAFAIILKEKGQVSLPELKFRVQVAAFNTGKKMDDPSLKSIVGLKVEKVNDTHYRYLSTAFNNAEQANKYANMLKKSNFPKAFVVAYYNGTKISMVKLKGILIN